ncbi:hypothetical protein F5H01DRAFT_333981 [Linnemannia elongata]|nr:hypothetical protein F5H01DRAFT_333981 [Linnemannia elongata]
MARGLGSGSVVFFLRVLFLLSLLMFIYWWASSLRILGLPLFVCLFICLFSLQRKRSRNNPCCCLCGHGQCLYYRNRRLNEDPLDDQFRMTFSISLYYFISVHSDKTNKTTFIERT